MVYSHHTGRRCYDKQKARKKKNVQITPTLLIQEKQKVQQTDVNQFVVKFTDQLQHELNASLQPFFKCKICQAILTSQSKTLTKIDYQIFIKQQTLQKKKQSDGKYLNPNQIQNAWICQFCFTHNSIPKNYNISKFQNPCFIIQQQQDLNKQTNIISNNQLLIFCIDISGSMQTIIESGHSRLKFLQQAIIDQIKKLRMQQSPIKIGIITFGNEVKIIGDGSHNIIKIPNHVYNNWQLTISESRKSTSLFSLSIIQSYQNLKTIADKLFAYGSTALGPALLSAIEIASTGSIGSKVIICTDGEANVGIGSNYDKEFYDKIGIYAKQKLVGVNVLTIKGDNCNLKQLGKVALLTNGQVLKVNPSALGSEFSKIITDQIYGSRAQIFIRLNRRFKFRNVNEKILTDNNSALKLNLGNFSKTTQIAYDFDLLSKQQAKELKTVDLQFFQQNKLPMQIQIQYIGKNSKKYLQVFTDWKELTENENQIFQEVDFGIYAANTLQKVSAFIKQEKFIQAKQLIQKYRKMCLIKFSKIQSNKKKIEKAQQRIKKLEQVLKNKFQKKGYNKSEKIYNLMIQQFAEYEEQQDEEYDNQSQEIQKQQQKKNRSRSRSRQKQTKKEKKQKDKKQKKKQKSKNKKKKMDSDSQQEVLFKELKAKSGGMQCQD